jgi:hypothetical protein
VDTSSAVSTIQFQILINVLISYLPTSLESTSERPVHRIKNHKTALEEKMKTLY